MYDLNKYLEEHIDTLVSDVEMLMAKDENEILGYVGNMLTANGYTVSENPDDSLIVPAKTFNMGKSFAAFHSVAGLQNMQAAARKSFADDVQKTEKSKAEESLKFKRRLEYAVCTSPALYQALGDNKPEGQPDGTLKDKVQYFLPLVLKAVGIKAIACIWVGVIAAALAMILKLGYTAYCSVYWQKNPKVLKKLKNEGGTQ